MKDRILFVFDYYKYNRNQTSFLEDLTFLFILSLLSLLSILILPRIILKRLLLSLIYKNNFDNFEGYEIIFESIFSLE